MARRAREERVGKKLAKATWEKREMPRAAAELREAPTVSLASSTPCGGRREARPSPLSPAAGGGGGGGGSSSSSTPDLALELSILVHGDGGGRIRSSSLLSVEGLVGVK
ncbi:unnamed protein product [Urochloa humidicola]